MAAADRFLKLLPAGSASAFRVCWARAEPVAVIASLLVASLIASAWLVFPYYVRDLNLIENVGSDVRAEKLNRAISIGKFLNRTTFGTGEAQVDVLYATPKFFELTDRSQIVTQYRPDLYHVFLVTETTHIEDLPVALPKAILKVDGRQFAPVDVEGPLEVYHHRTVTIRFPVFGEDGIPVVAAESRNFRLELFNSWDPGDGARVFEWQLPIEYPADLANRSPWTPVMITGLSAGLLSFVLTPCLLQLLAVFLVALTGFSADGFQTGSDDSARRSRRRLVFVALAFVAGFTVLFTLTGAAIGMAGKQMQMFFAVWSPTLTVIAGIVVIAMGLMVGIRSRSPVVCRLVPERIQNQLARPSSYVGSALVAAGFSLGCLTCFGGAIIATLLIYVGSLGSAMVGATVMFAFSLGVAVPFVLAAVFLSRVLPLLSRIQSYSPQVGLVSMVILVAFGVVLLTDRFHALSNFIYPYLGLA